MGDTMKQDEIIEMAKLAGFEMDDSGVLSPQVIWYIYHESLIKFAELVAAKEREACLNCYSPDDTATDWADKIRARY